PQADLIRLRADIPPDVAEVLATTPVHAEKGDGILILGPDAEDGSGRNALSGEISAVRDIYGFGAIVEISAPLTPGYSGSPVVNMEGDVIGVATFQMIGENKINFAVPSERIARLLPRMNKSIPEWEAERKKRNSDIKEELYLTGLGLMWAEEWESALYCLKGVVDEDPLYLIAYPWIGFCSLQLGLWEDAVDAYRQTLLIRPDDATAYSHLGIAYGKLNRWGEAVDAYRQAARLEPDAPIHRINLGFTYTKVGDWEKALENFSQAASLDADSDEAHFGMGLAYWVFGEDAKAWGEYETLKDLGSSLAADLYDYLSK
ncbi:tetratricopeptide repeat protein, partial [candidate division WOR-3 bacterium]|nr:tetratricopeptide repeat protein [candidate division WOR-3 bacterium]MBD3364112.1 tetratricopeptide repeat protein [candidate division WOR-3 bacterium]